MKPRGHILNNRSAQDELREKVAQAILNRQNTREDPLPKFYEEETIDWRAKGRLPKPLFQPNGKRLIILQDPPERKKGSIIVPDEAATKYRPTTGVVIGIGTGYVADHPLWDEYEFGLRTDMPVWASPFPVGTRVVWGRYHGDTRIALTVEDDWWDEGEARGEGTIPVILIHVADVIGVVPEDVAANALKSEIDELVGDPEAEEPVE